ncbi:unnamed protein product [Cylindrotheca closterium]|uniref:UBA domain-containing protein n=1 Tax=Cylindrotheca closterium TaxID=2856 RepID=A0AAD2PXC2_9STRA|nr:unnamed protein product [Cylindrotheca closterium]
MVPSVLAEWIATVVVPDSGVAASTLESKGLAVLKVCDLKKATSHSAHTPMEAPGTPQSSNSCHQPQQQKGTASNRNRRNNCHGANTTTTLHQGTAATRGNTSNSGRKRPAHQISRSSAPNPHTMPYTALLAYSNSGLPYPGCGATATTVFAPYAVSTNGTDGTGPQFGSMPPHYEYQNYLQQLHNPSFAAASSPPNPNRALTGGVANGQQHIPNPPNRGAGASGIHSQNTAPPDRNRPASAPVNGNTNNESITCAGDGNVPKTPQEFSFLNQLLGMGFQDREEVMLGIRQSNASTADEIMMWIIQQREEREEARKMDEARFRSEQLRKDNAEKQKRAFQERLDAAKSRDDFRNIFGKHSWVLDNLDDAHFRRLVSRHKDVLVRIVKLESSTRKWYQDKLPTCYFRDLCHRSNQQAVSEFDSWLIGECDTLEAGLYKLEFQQGGVPKLFLQAQENHPEYGESGENDESDDEIVFCGIRQSEGVN